MDKPIPEAAERARQCIVMLRQHLALFVQDDVAQAMFRDADEVVAALTAAQQQGQAVAWQINFTKSGCGWEACTRECYESTLATGRYMGLSLGTKDVMVRPLYTAPPSAPVGVEGLVQRLAGALAMYDQNRTTMQSLAGSVGDFLHCYHSLSQQPAASDSWRDAFVAERARRYRDGGMKIEQARIQAESDADLAIAIAAQQPAAVDGDFINRIADSLIEKGWDIDPNCDGTGVAQLRGAVISALATQHQEPTT